MEAIVIDYPCPAAMVEDDRELVIVPIGVCPVCRYPNDYHRSDCPIIRMQQNPKKS